MQQLLLIVYSLTNQCRLMPTHRKAILFLRTALYKTDYPDLERFVPVRQGTILC